MNNNFEVFDLLERKSFIDRLVEISESLSTNKENACYAINGEWGVGKTYILEAFEKRLRLYTEEDSTLNKYLVFHYNCWQYDYYEEPLIAIVAAILDQIDEQVNLIPDTKREIVATTLKVIGVSILEKVNSFIEEKTGINSKEISEIINSTREDASLSISKNHDYDLFFGFKKTLKKFSGTIKTLAEHQTVILVVDELDRCLPEYAIKVLERLHHVFDDIPNVQVIMAVDKQQLENTIKQIFGEKVSIHRYLSKFIDFELRLDTGEITKDIYQSHARYFSLFVSDFWKEPTGEEVCTTILKGIDIRTCKSILEKSFLCHRLLNPDNKKCDVAIMCVEIFLTILKEYEINIAFAKDNFNIRELFTQNSTRQQGVFSLTSKILPGLAILSEKYKEADEFSGYYHRDTIGNHFKTYIEMNDLWGILLGSYRKILGFEGDIWNSKRYADILFSESNLIKAIDIESYTLEYWKLIKILN